MAAQAQRHIRQMQASVGGVDLLIEAVPPDPGYGTEDTDGLGEGPVGRIDGAFDGAQQTLVSVASKVAAAAVELAKRAVQPDQIQVEFGLSFSTTGKAIVVSGTTTASLKITITYDLARQSPDSNIVTSDSPGD